MDNSNVVGNGTGTIIRQYPNNGINDDRIYDQIQLSGSNTYMSLFSKEANKLDFTKDFTGKFFVQFDKSNSDGLAFVMHNDPRGSRSLTKSVGIYDGQTLGVYGRKDGLESKGVYSNPYSTAILNSVAIEFDMKSNNTFSSSDKVNAFDLKTTNIPHMAYTFPGNSNSYQEVNFLNGDDYIGNGTWKQPYWLSYIPSPARIKHYIGNGKEGTQSIQDIGDGWYEFVFNYKVGTGLEYYLMNPDNGSTTSPVIISDKELYGNLNMTNMAHPSAYWGVTTANGAVSGTTSIVMAEMPIENISTLKNQLFNSDQNEISVAKEDDLTEKYILSGDNLTIQSTYAPGKYINDYTINSWRGKINPSIVAETLSNNITVSYKVSNSEPIQAEASIDAQGTITLPNLSVKMDQETSSFTVNVTIPIKKGLSSQKEMFYSSINGRYDSDAEDMIVESSTNYFWIKKANIPPVIDNITLSQASFTDFTDLVSFQWGYHDDDAIKDELNWKLEINNQVAEDASLIESLGEKINWQDTKKIDLLDKSTKYVSGENSIKITVTDSKGASDSKEIKFQVNGYKGFEKISDKFSWYYSLPQLPNEKIPQSREEDMVVKVRDTTTGNISSSKVLIAASTLTSKDRSISSDNFVFKINNRIMHLNEVELNVNQEYYFSKSEGLLLNINNQDSIGEYLGEITWTIQDAP